MRKYFTKWEEVLEFKMIEKPFKPHVFPFLFVPMDSPQMYEDCLRMVNPNFFSFWSQDLLSYPKLAREKVLDTIILSTVGDNI
jgi:hypothetical protein